MAKVQVGKWEVEEEELERQHREAIKRGMETAQSEPQAKTVGYDRPTNRLIIELRSGIIFLLPCALVQGLAKATPDDIAQVRLGPRGASLHWDRLSVDFSLSDLMAGAFGTHAWMAEMGRTGGISKPKARVSRTHEKRDRQPLGLRTAKA
ncbi:MAG: DUF2442 domain-containing protein [Chloroflexi bacterium HGW-Chloroflexi-1]|nr:MAG: DUF2442 domain-containing protein [Chloroflexi bacterium HGW-Chloroflexi-1]